MRRITRSNEKINYEDEIRDMPHDEFKDYCLKVSKEIDVNEDNKYLIDSK